MAYFNELSRNLLMVCFHAGLLLILILHRMDLCSVADVLEVYAASIFSVEVNMASVSAYV
jgi:nitrate reductase gamma subunit